MKSETIELGEITPYHFSKKLILPLDERWSEYFNSKNNSFKVVINDNKIMLIGPKVSNQSPTTKTPPTKEMISNFD